MEYDKAIEIVGHKGYGYPENEIREAFGMAVEAMESKSEAEEYRTPKKVLYSQDDERFHCPNCRCIYENPLIPGSVFPNDYYAFCPNCGQALDWSEVG